MSKKTEVVWINSLSGTIGIVLLDNGFEKKAYIKAVDGISESADIADILDTGGKILPSQAEQLFNHLNKNN